MQTHSGWQHRRMPIKLTKTRAQRLNTQKTHTNNGMRYRLSEAVKGQVRGKTH